MRQEEAALSVQDPGCPGPPWAGPTAQGPRSPACWMREAGVEATGSAALRSRLAVAPVGGPGGRARVADPRSCPILSSRSCSRRSRSTSSGFRAAPCGDGKIRPGEPYEVRVLRGPAPPQGRTGGGRPDGHLREEAPQKPVSPTSSPQSRKPERPRNYPRSHSTEKQPKNAQRKEEAGCERQREVTLSLSHGASRA